MFIASSRLLVLLLSKAEEEALALPLSYPLPPKASKKCTLSGALVTTVPLTDEGVDIDLNNLLVSEWK